MQRIKQSKKIYNMSTFFSLIDVHAQMRMSRNAYSGVRRAYALMRAGTSKRAEILT